VPLEEVAEEMRAGVVLLAGGIDGGNAHQIGGELDHLVGCAVDFRRHAIDKGGAHDAIL
jgi:hypothetical protein